MSSLPYPGGAAHAIAHARAGGMKPSETVLVVLSGRHEWPNPQVFADPAKQYRWDWLRGLGVVLMIAATTRIGDILAQIDQAEPTQIDVVDFERRKAWQVLFTRPRVKTVRWPASWVEDWLGPCTWHAELQATKARAQMLARSTSQQNPTFDQEPEWN
jgi:hypothetical protein